MAAGEPAVTIKNGQVVPYKLPSIDVSDYDQLYDTFDKGHTFEGHVKGVRETAKVLAAKYDPENVELADLAARLHDVGISKDREEHEREGHKMLASDPRFKVLPPDKRKLLLESIRQHRASTGKPKSTFAKIIADADRSSQETPGGALNRAYQYGKTNYPHLNDNEQILRALLHLQSKFGLKGYGRKTHFPETAKMYSEIYDPLNELADKADIESARKLLAAVPPEPVKIAASAPGIPDKDIYGEPIKRLEPGKLVEYVLQHHTTARNPTRPHLDLRLGTPATNLFSWAVPGGDLPEEGKKKLAPQVQVHEFSYGNFAGRLPSGYGEGTVKMQDKGKALITKVTPSSIHFTLAHTKVPTRYALIHIGTGNDSRDWLLTRKTMPKTIEGVGEKPRMQLIQAADLDEALAQAQVVQEKIDGAAGIYEIGPEGKIEAYSVNPRVTGEPIVHTERLGLYKNPASKSLSGTSLRGEMYGVDPKGKALSFNEISGILNAGVAKSMEMQRAKKVKMTNAIFGLTKYKGKDVSQMSPEEQRELLHEVVRGLPADQFHEPETAETAEEKSKLLEDIRTGKNPRTQEGIVLRMPDGKLKKHKLFQEATGYVTGTYPGEGKRKVSAGGLTFALEPGGETAGQVGSGFTDTQLADISKNLNEYMGKPMRLQHQGQFEATRKLRAPTFTGWELDKPAAIIKDGQVSTNLPIADYVPTHGYATNALKSIQEQLPWPASMAAKPAITKAIKDYAGYDPKLQTNVDVGSYKAMNQIAGKELTPLEAYKTISTNLPPEVFKGNKDPGVIAKTVDSIMGKTKWKGYPDKPQQAATTPATTPVKEGQAAVPFIPGVLALVAAKIKEHAASKTMNKAWAGGVVPILPPAPPVSVSGLLTIDQLKSYLDKYEASPRVREQVLEQGKRILKFKNNAAWFDTGSRKPSGVIAAPGLPTEVYKHEYGHAKDYINQLVQKGHANMGGRLTSTLLAPIVGAKHTPLYKTEERAWDYSGVPKGNPLRDSALGTYEAGMKGPEWVGRFGIPGYMILKALTKRGAAAAVIIKNGSVTCVGAN